jgi:hypothetical protein
MSTMAWLCLDESAKAVCKPALASVRRLARADDADHLVDVVDGDAQAFDDVLAFSALASRKRVRRRITSLRCEM